MLFKSEWQNKSQKVGEFRQKWKHWHVCEGYVTHFHDCRAVDSTQNFPSHGWFILPIFFITSWNMYIERCVHTCRKHKHDKSGIAEDYLGPIYDGAVNPIKTFPSQRQVICQSCLRHWTFTKPTTAGIPLLSIGITVALGRASGQNCSGSPEKSHLLHVGMSEPPQ